MWHIIQVTTTWDIPDDNLLVHIPNRHMWNKLLQCRTSSFPKYTISKAAPVKKMFCPNFKYFKNSLKKHLTKFMFSSCQTQSIYIYFRGSQTWSPSVDFWVRSPSLLSIFINCSRWPKKYCDHLNFGFRILRIMFNDVDGICCDLKSK